MVSANEERLLLSPRGNETNYNVELKQYQLAAPTAALELRVKNQLTCHVEIEIELVIDKKFAPVNHFRIDSIAPLSKRTFETYAQNRKLLYAEVKMCYGKLKETFYRHSADLQERSPVKHETTASDESAVHHINVDDPLVIFELENPENEFAIY